MSKGAYNLEGAADYCGVSQRTISREITDGKIAVKYIRSKAVILAAELDSYLESLPEDPA